MARFLCGVAVIGAMLLSCSATFAEKDVDSANYMMAGRRSFIVKPPDNDYFLNGRCAGIVETLIEFRLGRLRARKLDVGTGYTRRREVHRRPARKNA